MANQNCRMGYKVGELLRLYPELREEILTRRARGDTYEDIAYWIRQHTGWRVNSATVRKWVAKWELMSRD